jgi:hypothetical protein
MKNTIVLLVVIILLALGGYYFLNKAPEPVVTEPIVEEEEVTYQILSPKVGDEWETEKEYVISWTPKESGTVSLSIINSALGAGYKYHICSSVPPYSCEIPNTGEFRFGVPLDDGHNEWQKSGEYQIALARNASSEILATSGKFSIVYPANKVVTPPAPGPFVADAVRNLKPVTLKVGANTISAEVRGFMFFEGESQLRIYDGLTEVNTGKRTDGLPNTVLTAQGEWMTEGYVPVSQTINIPASLKGKTLIIRFVANDPSDNARPRYWGTWMKVE